MRKRKIGAVLLAVTMLQVSLAVVEITAQIRRQAQTQETRYQHQAHQRYRGKQRVRR